MDHEEKEGTLTLFSSATRSNSRCLFRAFKLRENSPASNRIDKLLCDIPVMCIRIPVVHFTLCLHNLLHSMEELEIVFVDLV